MGSGTEKFIKLTPYLILDTDPTMNNLNATNVSTRIHMAGHAVKDYPPQSLFETEPIKRLKEAFEQHDNLKQRMEMYINKEKEESKSVGQFTNTLKNDTRMKPHIAHQQRKILIGPLSSKPRASTMNSHMQKTKSTALVKNYGLNNTNPTVVENDPLPFRKHVEIKKTYKLKPSVSKNVINDFKVKETLVKKKNQLVQSLQKNLEHNFTVNQPNKLLFEGLSLDVQKSKYISKQHSAIRNSLFSNVPPYIKFSSHDVKGEPFPLFLQEILEWELSSITPIVVRNIVQNSGFKLVTNDHNLTQNNPNNSINQSNQNMDSLSNDTGITPSIVKRIDGGTASLPGVSMVLAKSQSNNWVGVWEKHMKSSSFKTLKEQQKFNHFPGTFQIGRKDLLWKNLNKYMMMFGTDEFGFIPTSYILPQEANCLRDVWEKNDEDKWIIKPPASARGTGIRVISKWNEIPRKVPLVVQRYIDNPYLINDSKFDLRLYVLITSINPLRLYLCDNGLVRFASVKYSSDPNTISNRYMHLTNYSINRLSSQYTQNVDANACQGHKWTLKSLWTYMEKERQVDVKKLWDSLEDLVIKTVISGESAISYMCSTHLNNRYNSYELLGFDVLFDEYLKPWILEVNISPSLHTSSSLDLAVKGKLIKDLLNTVGFHIPNEISSEKQDSLIKTLGIRFPLCHDKRIYTNNLSTNERKKQDFYTNPKPREDYIDTILNELSPDDVRHLLLYEDELTQVGSFQKLFPTRTSHKYLRYFSEHKYYNMLFDAWERKYSENRKEGIAVLEKFCQTNFHLETTE